MTGSRLLFLRVRSAAAILKWREVIERDVCVWCGVRGRKVRLTREHVEPVSTGGNNTGAWWNIVGAHQGCNRLRRNRPLLQEMLRLKRLKAGQ